MVTELIKTYDIPKDYLKSTAQIASNAQTKIEVYTTKVVAINSHRTAVWYFNDFKGVDFIKANMNSQYAQIIFLTDINSKTRFLGIDIGCEQNHKALNNNNNLLFCSGLFSFKKTNKFVQVIFDSISQAFYIYRDAIENEKQIHSLI